MATKKYEKMKLTNKQSIYQAPKLIPRSGWNHEAEYIEDLCLRTTKTAPSVSFSWSFYLFLYDISQNEECQGQLYSHTSTYKAQNEGSNSNMLTESMRFNSWNSNK